MRPPGSTVPVGAAILLVSAGGAAGATARWWLGTALPTSTGTFPWTTFAVNVTGSFLLALLLATPAVRRPRLGPHLTPLLGPGLLGGFTTLSATSEEGRALVATGHSVLAAAYLAGTLVAALLAVALAGLLTPTAVAGGRR